MIYSNRLAYRVDVTVEIMAELGGVFPLRRGEGSSDDIRRTIDIFDAFGDRYDVFTGVDNLAYEALAVGAVSLGRRPRRRLPARDRGDLPADEGQALP